MRAIKAILSCVAFAGALGALMGCGSDSPSSDTSGNAAPRPDPAATTIVLSAPSVNDSYYRDIFDEVIDFQVRYARTILGSRDDVIVVADADTMPMLERRLPARNLLVKNIDDIWIRDFSTVYPRNRIQFRYRPGYLPRSEALSAQASFDRAFEKVVSYRRTRLILDGGNFVDNDVDSAVVTERFLEDNDLTKVEGIRQIRRLTGVANVAIVPYDDEITGHADGMVSFIEKDTLAVNEYRGSFRKDVLRELRSALPGVRIVEVPADFEVKQWRDFSSACGISVNATVTNYTVFVPVFGGKADDRAVAAMRRNTNKEVRPVDARGVCVMGGSVRCLSWQVTGKDAARLAEVARAAAG